MNIEKWAANVLATIHEFDGKALDRKALDSRLLVAMVEKMHAAGIAIGLRRGAQLCRDNLQPVGKVPAVHIFAFNLACSCCSDDLECSAKKYLFPNEFSKRSKAKNRIPDE